MFIVFVIVCVLLGLAFTLLEHHTRKPVPSVLNVVDFEKLPLHAKGFLCEQELEGKLTWKSSDYFLFTVAEMSFNNRTVKLVAYPLARKFVRLNCDTRL